MLMELLNIKMVLHLGSVRFTSLEYHDRTYNKFPENLRYFQQMYENGQLIDCMEVYRRARNMEDYSENTLVYSSDRSLYGLKTASDWVDEYRKSEPQLQDSDILDLYDVIGCEKNREYFINQNVIKSISINLGEILKRKRETKGEEERIAVGEEPYDA